MEKFSFPIFFKGGCYLLSPNTHTIVYVWFLLDFSCIDDFYGMGISWTYNVSKSNYIFTWILNLNKAKLFYQTFN